MLSMVSILQALILGIVQGVTEWLPISSSGHLVLFQRLFGINVPTAFDIFLHFGSLLVILYYFRKDILKILDSLFKWKTKSEDFKMIWYVFIASIPAGIVGLFFLRFFESLFHSLLAVGLAMLINAMILFSTRFIKGEKKISADKSFFVGLGQAISITPGISRSGTTISFGLISKIKKEDAFKLSFLMAIPALLFANLIEMKALLSSNIEIWSLITGLITSVVVGYASISSLFKLIKQNKLHYFAYYSLILGLIIILYLILV